MGNNSIRYINFYKTAFKPFSWLITVQLTIALFFALDLSLRPYLTKIILDRLDFATKSEVVSLLFWPSLFYLGMGLLITLSHRILDWVWLKISPGLKRHIGLILMDRMIGHDQAMFGEHFSGGLAAQIKEVMSAVPDVLRIAINRFLSNALAITIAIYTAGKVHPYFSLGLFVWAVIFIIGVLWCFRRIEDLSGRFARTRTKHVGLMVDILSNILNVKLFAAKDQEVKHIKKSLNKYYNKEQSLHKFLIKMYLFQGVSFFIYQSFSLIGLIYGFKNNIVTTGDFALLLTLNIYLVDRLWLLSKDISEFAEKTGNIKQGLELVYQPVRVIDNPKVDIPKKIKGEIVFDKVGFHYKKVRPLFVDLSTKIPAGQKVGLVGFSGGGKSTFASIILRLYDVSSGKILIDGHDIKEIPQDFLRQNIGMIPQNPTLFNRTIFENISFAKPNATKDEVINACKNAFAHEFISNMPEGYESQVGERGGKLSGGQRQRLAIARIFLKDPPILILDEATSQLDAYNEEKIQMALLKLMKGKTTLVIAHRLSTLKQMDRILVFEKGNIVEDGSHEQLIKQKGLYATLWRSQVGGFIQDESDEEEEEEEIL